MRSGFARSEWILRCAVLTAFLAAPALAFADSTQTAAVVSAPRAFTDAERRPARLPSSAWHVALSTAATAGPAALAPANAYSNHGEFWQIVHAGLVAGPAAGYVTGARPSDAWRGLALRSAIAAGAALAGAYDDAPRGLDRRRRTAAAVSTVALGLSAAWDIARLPAGVRRAALEPEPPDALGRRAFQLSIAGTVVPAMPALAANEGGLAALGLIAGPATGYIYGRRTWRGLAGVALRGALAGATQATWSLDDADARDTDAVRVIGAVAIVGSAAWDIARVRDAVKPRDDRLGVRLAPASLLSGAPALAVAITF